MSQKIIMIVFTLGIPLALLALKRTPLKRIGRTTQEWTEFANTYAEECRDSQGLLWCEADTHHELCPIGSSRLDLHHKISKANRPDLRFHKPNLIWLSRWCHSEVHGTANSNPR